jgi:hypothetical protein
MDMLRTLFREMPVGALLLTIVVGLLVGAINRRDVPPWRLPGDPPRRRRSAFQPRARRWS